MDEPEFRALYASTFDDVWRFARRRCASSEAAGDVTAETFATAWRRRTQLPVDGAARLWLFGAARRVLANHQRGERRRMSLHERLAATWTPPSSPDPAESIADAGLASALATLRPSEREVLVMQAWDDLSVTEIARVLECSPNAVSVRLHKARRRLAAALETDRSPDWTGTKRSPVTTGDGR